MHPQRRSFSPRAIRRAARFTPVAALLALPVAVMAQAVITPNPVGRQDLQGSSPYYIGASQAFSRDSNIFRAARDPVDRVLLGQRLVADTISTTSLLAGIDQPIGRQRLTANASVRHNKYQDESQLDNTGYRLGLGLDWETIERLSGTLSAVAQQGLARYGIESRPNTTQRNIERARELDATVQYGGPSVLAIYGLFNHREIDYSLPQFDSLEYKRDQAGVGVRYRVGGALTVGAEARATTGEYPRFQESPAGSGNFVADEFDRTDLSLTAQWVPSGASQLSARIGAARQKHDVAARDFSGATGSLRWDWQPTGKLGFITEVRRNTGQEIDPLTVAGLLNQVVGDNSFVSNRLEVRGLYAATAKIQLDALLSYTRRSLIDTTSLINNPAQLGANAGSDKTTRLLLGARYQPTRTIELGCSAGREERNSNVSSSGFVTGGPVSYSYRVNSARCFAQLLLQP